MSRTDYNTGPVNVYRVLAGGGLLALGPTQGGVTLSFDFDTSEILFDTDGTAPMSEVITGAGGTLSVPMTALSFQKLVNAIPGSEVQYAPSGRFYVGNPVGLNLGDISIQLLLKRIENGIETTDPFSTAGNAPNWITILRAAPVSPGSLTYDASQQIIEVIFQIYPDPTQLTPLGLASLVVFGTPPGVIGSVLGSDAGYFQGVSLNLGTISDQDGIIYDAVSNTYIPGGGSPAWELDVNDDLMPVLTMVNSVYWETDVSDDLMPVSA